MIRAVLDCNVVITAALTGGKCAELLLRARRRDGFQLVWSPPIVAECLRVIEYPKLAGKFRTDPRLLVERAMASAVMVPTDLLPALQVVRADPTDDVYLATAVAGGARWLVTGNTRHLIPLDGWSGVRIVEPAVFLAELCSR
ncbi:MAG TPA: putative toxin-antitoxin system toxin component, PIN family [Anaeromyxobacteraceae bacterium]|nr:putative toxin-antitoxin system toxin component, PIN family [Anaeromyxobacteraceae bacterium]